MDKDDAKRAATMTLPEYTALVEQVMQDALIGGPAVDRVFENSGEPHATVVLGTMLDHAQGQVALYTAEMNSDVWNAGRVRAFLTRAPEATMRVVVDADDVFTSPNSALRDMTDLVRSGRIEIRKRTPGAQLPHVAIVDGRHVRIERNHRDRKAVVGFGNKELGERATNFFDQVWSDATPKTI
jgi:hypothetical protein